MREFKFRVWDKKEERFIEWFNPDPMISCGSGKIFCYERREGSEDELNNLRDAAGELVVQQYTGLKDKNGKEVYEGDIVLEKMTDEMAEEGDSCNVGKVFFAAGSFMIDGDTTMYANVRSLTPDILEDYTVIGNIFENPELLK